MSDDLNEILDAVDALLLDRPITTAAEARLALIYMRHRPGEFGRDGCTCDDRENCDECASAEAIKAHCERLVALADEAAAEWKRQCEARAQ